MMPSTTSITMPGNAATRAPASDLPAARPLDYLPVGLFGSVMGLTGLSVAWRFAHARFDVPMAIADGIAVVAVLAFVAMAIGYLVKAVNAPQAVRAEFRHPVAGPLFGTILISLLLLPIVIAPVWLGLARATWALGTIGMLGFAWSMMDRWTRGRQAAEHATPAWIVPVVGLLDVPLAIPSLDLPMLHGLMVMALAVGLFFAIPLFTMIFSRLLFQEPMPDPLQPSLMILLAPFAVGTSAYVTTTGSFDLFAEGLYAIALFLLVVLLGRLRHVARCCPFRVTWWAVSFPLAACAIASQRMAATYPSNTNDAIAWVLLAGTSAIVAWLSWRTLSGIARGELRRLT